MLNLILKSQNSLLSSKKKSPYQGKWHKKKKNWNSLWNEQQLSTNIKIINISTKLKQNLHSSSVNLLNSDSQTKREPFESRAQTDAIMSNKNSSKNKTAFYIDPNQANMPHLSLKHLKTFSITCNSPHQTGLSWLPSHDHIFPLWATFRHSVAIQTAVWLKVVVVNAGPLIPELKSFTMYPSYSLAFYKQHL